MKAVGNWVLIKQAETTTASGLTVSNLNIGEIISVPRLPRDTLDFNNGDKVYFNKRNAITIEEYLLVTIHDIFLVIT
jgi:co-chaperonin GroES (HSP10)